VTDAHLFVVSVTVGAALLALWLELRYPSLAPEGLIRRFVAVGLGCVVVQLGGLGFERALAVPLGSTTAALLALAALLPAMTFGFLTAVWLLRSLQGLGAMR
jgi:hypothetical protein